MPATEFADSVDRGCPMVLGGPLGHVMAAKAVALAEARTPAFQTYAQAIVDNAQALAEGLLQRGRRLVTGGTDNHLVLIDVSGFGITGRQAESALLDVGHRDQPQRRPARPERRLVHLRHPDRHPGADHPRLRRRRVRPVADLIVSVLKNTTPVTAASGSRARRSTASPTASPMPPRQASAELPHANPSYPGLEL